MHRFGFGTLVLAILFATEIYSGSAFDSQGFDDRSRVRRGANPQQHQPMPAMPMRSVDRSVYARRNFALPDVVSDVYEVYVGPTSLAENSGREAVAIMQGKTPSGTPVSGVISFRQAHPNDPVFINGTITGLTPGKHGFHVHQKGDLRDGCTSTGSHFNPYNQQHGAPIDKNRHVGDLGNIEAGNDGRCDVFIVDRLISLYGVNSVLARGIVVHANVDDLGKGMNADSKTTGNSGGRVGCGVIGLA